MTQSNNPHTYLTSSNFHSVDLIQATLNTFHVNSSRRNILSPPATFPSPFPAITFASQLITEIISVIISAQLLHPLSHLESQILFRTHSFDTSSSLEIAWILKEFPSLFPLDRQSINRQKTSKACTGKASSLPFEKLPFSCSNEPTNGFRHSYSLVTGKC